MYWQASVGIVSTERWPHLGHVMVDRSSSIEIRTRSYRTLKANSVNGDGRDPEQAQVFSAAALWRAILAPPRN